MSVTSTVAPESALPNSKPQSPAAGGLLCWKFTASGEWITAPAPWRKGEAGVWFWNNTGRRVFTTRDTNDADEGKPAIKVYEVRGSDPSDPTEAFVAVFEGMQHEWQGEEYPVDTYFFVEPPAVAKLVAEFATLLTVHPQKLSIENYKVRT